MRYRHTGIKAYRHTRAEDDAFLLESARVFRNSERSTAGVPARRNAVCPYACMPLCLYS